MDIATKMRISSNAGSTVLHTVTMHTTGEPTRIVVDGYPQLDGSTLLEKRACARKKHDHLRRRLIHVPRGHRDMYGAILVHDTEYMRSGDADIGVLFIHNEGYSTMCGHATLALGRLLIDTRDTAVFPRRSALVYDSTARTTSLRLHAPCGVVRVTVPVIHDNIDDANSAPFRSDPTRAVSFLSVPSFAAATGQRLAIPPAYQWPELAAKQQQHHTEPAPRVTLDIAYGGAFYAIVPASALGFGALAPYTRDTLTALDRATALLKRCIHATPRLRALLAPAALYGVTVVDDACAHSAAADTDGVRGADVNLCFFADQQLDRSPTGSCVSARVALAVATGALALRDAWAYHSVVSAQAPRAGGAFVGSAVERVGVVWEEGKEAGGGGGGGVEDGGEVVGGWLVEAGKDVEAVVVKVEGKAWYIGTEAVVVEEGDPLGDGFLIG